MFKNIKALTSWRNPKTHSTLSNLAVRRSVWCNRQGAVEDETEEIDLDREASPHLSLRTPCRSLPALTLCGRTTTSKGLQSDSLDPPDTPQAALTTIHSLIRRFGLDLAVSKNDRSGSEPANFSKVTYAQVSPLVGLDPGKELRDIETFEIHRSRIPTGLFRSIITDMDMMLMQYGSPPEHKTEEARSRFFSPVFNHLIKLFSFQLRNEPETMIDSRISTQGRVEYFCKTFGAVAVLCVEMRPKVGNDDERLKIVAQVIAECDRSDLENSTWDFSLPIHCIFTDGLTYEFFKFERNPKPTFVRGCFIGDPVHLRRGLKVPNYSSMTTALPFILHLRCACETVFDVMLNAYIAGLKASVRSQEKGWKQGTKRLNLDGWDQAVQSAERALVAFRVAEVQRKNGDLDSADTTVDQALLKLQDSTEAVPTFYRSRLIMKDWDDIEVRKA